MALTESADPKKKIMGACEFGWKSQNCSAFWKASSVGWVPEQACRVVSANKCHTCPDAMMREVFKPHKMLLGCFSIAAIKMNRPNQGNILCRDSWHVSLKIRSTAFKYKLLCTM